MELTALSRLESQAQLRRSEIRPTVLTLRKRAGFVLELREAV